MQWGVTQIIEQIDIVSQQEQTLDLLDITVLGGTMQSFSLVPIFMIVGGHWHRRLMCC